MPEERPHLFRNVHLAGLQRDTTNPSSPGV
jgi:hypothetical protein